MYYSNGNYEAFANPLPPADSAKKSAYIVGGGLAGLAAAVFMIRDGKMRGNKIHIFEELPIAGGSMDGIKNPQRGFIIRGGREMEAHFETLWDLFRSIPSLENPDISVLDEFYWLNKSDPSFSHCRAIERRGHRMRDDGKLTLTPTAIREMIDLALTPEEKLQDVQIDQVFGNEFFESNFWLYWATMFAFEKWSSAMEMRRYLLRFIHHVGKLADMSALKFTKYNQYESLITPLVRWLESHGVKFHFDTTITNLDVNCKQNKKVAQKIEMIKSGRRREIKLSPDDLVFVTNGSITESTTYGDNDTPADKKHELGASWQLWKNLAAQCDEFGKPEKFCENIPDANWVISATITLFDDTVVPYIEKICKKDPHSGSIVSSGPVTIKDSNWLYGFSISRQPHFRAQKPNEIVVWTYGLLSDTDGNYIKKKIADCTGAELCAEWLYHIGVPTSEIEDIAHNRSNTVPSHMPYITTYFMPRALGDRPLVVPKGSVNLAFIGNYAETERDTVFTTEYSVRTAMQAVYTLLKIDRGVPEVFDSCFDIRMLLQSIYYLNDGKKLRDLDVPWVMKLLEKQGMNHVRGTYLEQLLREAKLI